MGGGSYLTAKMQLASSTATSSLFLDTSHVMIKMIKNLINLTYDNMGYANN